MPFATSSWLDLGVQVVVAVGLLSPVIYYLLRRYDKRQEARYQSQEYHLTTIYDAVNRVEEDEKVPPGREGKMTLGSLLRSVSKDVAELKRDVQETARQNSDDHARLYRHVTEVHQSLTERIDQHDDRLREVEATVTKPSRVRSSPTTPARRSPRKGTK